MSQKQLLGTDSYKGVRDFYPDDMAVQQYIFDVWSQTAESFGYARYDASVLEPSTLYKAKGAENEEMVNEQTYTFTDRSDREVTLRPEMTPSVARMIAKKRRELSFPVRWYSIPNLFRYERTQRGRLREHWQLNCDIFGADDYTADVEIIALAYRIFMNFGADPEMFEIRINNRKLMETWYTEKLGLTEEQIPHVTRLVDKKNKMDPEDFVVAIHEMIEENIDIFNTGMEAKTAEELYELEPNVTVAVENGLRELGITNVRFDPTLARGFDYYTGTVFEIFDTSEENNRSLMGGGRYDNLTALFGGESISGIGFGLGDVTMRDFLETHNLLTANIPSPELVIIPNEHKWNLHGQKIAQEFRAHNISVSVDIGTKKIGKKIASAGSALIGYALVFGEDEVKTEQYILKNLSDGTETAGSIAELIKEII